MRISDPSFCSVPPAAVAAPLYNALPRSRPRPSGPTDHSLHHATHTMSGHYASGNLKRLMREANLVLNRQETRTMLRIVAARLTSPKTATSGIPRDLWINGPAEVPRLHGGLGFAGLSS